MQINVFYFGLEFACCEYAKYTFYWLAHRVQKLICCLSLNRVKALIGQPDHKCIESIRFMGNFLMYCCGQGKKNWRPPKSRLNVLPNLLINALLGRRYLLTGVRQYQRLLAATVRRFIHNERQSNA